MFRIVALALLASVQCGITLPATAQSLDAVEGRVKRLESEMKAVQRKVFPGGNKAFFEPEITAPEASPAVPGAPASTPLADLMARVDSLEKQLVTLTGQVEENGFKVRQMEAAFEKFKADAQFRLTTLEGGTPAPTTPGAPAAAAAKPPAAPAPAQANAALEPIEAEYRVAYGQVVAKNWLAAVNALSQFLAKHPGHARASHAAYWLGRSYYADKRPVEAARAFLDNYQRRPEGERAPDSLLWLGKSLMAFTPPSPTKACEAYQQMDAAYAKTLTDTLKTQLKDARTAAKCS
jgi:TolA-binding protein